MKKMEDKKTVITTIDEFEKIYLPNSISRKKKIGTTNEISSFGNDMANSIFKKLTLK
ncbi:hypothetical protein ACFLWK_00075 [Chloroflexota bacterium]